MKSRECFENRAKREFYVYRYTEKKTKSVVYVGKTNCSLKARINAHKREQWFAPYDCYVEYVKLSNEVETDSVEKFLINYYKPCINLKDKVPFVTQEINLSGLDWHPYEEYLESIKIEKGQYHVLKNEALKQAYVLEQLEEALMNEREEIILPFVAIQLPTFNGTLDFSELEVKKEKNGYVHKIKKTVGKEIEEKYNEILACIWMPVATLNDQGADGLVLFENAMELFADMTEFAKNGYLYEEGFYEQFMNVLPVKYEKVVHYFEEYTEPVQTYGEKMYIEWNQTQNDEMPKIKESICRDFVSFLRIHNIWSYKDNYSFVMRIT